MPVAANIPTGRPFGITPHSLRHSAATCLINGHLVEIRVKDCQKQFMSQIEGI